MENGGGTTEQKDGGTKTFGNVAKHHHQKMNWKEESPIYEKSESKK